MSDKMNIVFFAHPAFLGSQSMPRYADMLVKGMKRRGHKVRLLSPRAFLYRIPAPRAIRKYLGYVDQYIIFPMLVSGEIRRCQSDTLFVFTDHALGPWFRLIGNHSHVIHCHDFLAQRAARHRIPQNRTAWPGRLYQAFIHRGYSKAKYFISVSNKTRDDLHAFLPSTPMCSEVVYNAMNQAFQPCSPPVSRLLLSIATGLSLKSGYMLHVGGNQWYKNRPGVIEIYTAWRAMQRNRQPLVMVGRKPDKALLKAYHKSCYHKDIFFVENLSDTLLLFAYAGASVLLFPSLAEGFGWPIAEAMASGCPVITSNTAPMTEVAGDAALLIALRPDDEQKVRAWAQEAACTIDQVMTMRPRDRRKIVEAGLVNVRRFSPERTLDQIEKIYRNVLSAVGTEKVAVPGENVFFDLRASNINSYENTSRHTII